jgi:hypothetical protein
MVIGVTVQEIEGAILRRALALGLSQRALWKKDIHRAAHGQHFGKEIYFVEDHGYLDKMKFSTHREARKDR